MIEQENKNNLSSLIHSDGKLMEWIQQNRPRTAVKETMDNKSPLSPEKLPYYGKYCGSFVENVRIWIEISHIEPQKNVLIASPKVISVSNAKKLEFTIFLHPISLVN